MNTIFDPTSLESEIRQSHERSRQYGIDPNKIINPKHVRLSPKSLQDLLEENQDYFSIDSGQMEELFCLFTE